MSENVETDYLLDPKNVARAFDRAALSYRHNIVVQKLVMDRLFERLELLRLDCKNILDLGCGIGMAGTGLRKFFNSAKIHETDLSLGMLRHSCNKGWLAGRGFKQVCADAHSLPFEDNMFDLVFSSLMLQWCSHIHQVIKEVTRILRPGGLFMFSTFGPDTLLELRESWQQADDEIHVMAFYDMHDVGDVVMRSGLRDAVLDNETVVFHYQDCMSLMNELKTTGASNRVQSRRKSLTGKARLKSMINAYETLRSKEGLPATYEIIYGHAWNLDVDNRHGTDKKEYSVSIETVSKAIKKNKT